MPPFPPLEARLRAQIKETGPIPVREFMEQVLYDPIDGYYFQKIPIGREGDYITAPEMTQAFGEAIAIWLFDIWQQAGKPLPFQLVELGPGRGTLMADMLRTFQRLPLPLSGMAVHLVDISPPLRKIQQKTLSTFPFSFHWHQHIDTLPEGFCLMVGNEFWDALPISQFFPNKHQGEVSYSERCISLKSDHLVFLPEEPGGIRERSEAIHQLALKLGHHLEKNRGVALFLDYGHDNPSGTGDTLQAIFRHQRCSPLEHIGQADLTCHVDFYTLKKALASTLYVHGPIPQGAFLKAMGLDARTERLCERATPRQQASLRTAAIRLMHPAYMGTLFKAIAAVSDPSFCPAGF